MAEVGRHLCRSAGPTPNAQAGSATAGGPGPCPDSFCVSPGMETPPPSLCNLRSALSLTVKKVFTDVQAKPCFSLYPLLLVPSLCTTEKPYLCLLLFPHTDDVLPEPSLFWALSAFLHRRDTAVPPSFQWLLAALCPAAPHLLCTGEPQPEPCTPSAPQKGRSCSSLSLLLPGYPWWPVQLTPYRGLCC